MVKAAADINNRRSRKTRSGRPPPRVPDLAPSSGPRCNGASATDRWPRASGWLL
jgi:hypothetical protein